MDSRRHFLRGLARAATGAGRPDALPATPALPAEAAVDRHAPASGGRAGQEALGNSAVLVVGAGALATPVLGYLAGAGVGRLGVLDHADVALTDLQAETVHYTPDVGVPKARSAAVKLGFLNPEIVVEPYRVRLDADNAEGLLDGQDLVVDCSNEAGTQDVVAATCAQLGIALVAAGASGDRGWVLSVPAGERACRVCAAIDVVEAPSPASGATAGVVGSLQSREVLGRLLASQPTVEALHVDLQTPCLRRSRPARRPDCPACSSR